MLNPSRLKYLSLDNIGAISGAMTSFQLPLLLILRYYFNFTSHPIGQKQVHAGFRLKGKQAISQSNGSQPDGLAKAVGYI